MNRTTWRRRRSGARGVALAAVMGALAAVAVPADAADGPPPGPAYDLATLPVFSKSLFYLRENYVDKSRFHFKRMLLGALDFMARDTPEIALDPIFDQEPRQVTVRVDGQARAVMLDRVDAAWSLRSTLQDICRFVQASLPPLPPREAARRTLNIEIAAVNGMLYTLDPHSVLLDADSYAEMRTQRPAQAGSVGLVLEMDRQRRIVVKSMFPGSSAVQQGLQRGDRIVRLGDEPALNMTLDQAVTRLRGEIGSKLDIHVERASGAAPRTITVTRAFIAAPAIEPPPRVLTVAASPGQPAAKVGYVRLRHFSSGSGDDVAHALQIFKRQSVKGVVLDLRGNSGGLYAEAGKVADAFIESGTLVSMVGAGGTQRQDEQATRSGDEPQGPVAVLVDQGTAAAAEIVAAAIRNAGHGVLIGRSTFGSGTVQVLFDIAVPRPDLLSGDKLGLKLTTAQFLVAGGASILGVGLTPDIQLEPQWAEKDGDRWRVHTRALPRGRQESDYEWSLRDPSARPQARPLETVWYVVPRVPCDEDCEDDAEAGAGGPGNDAAGDVDGDFPVALARDFVAQARTADRGGLPGAPALLAKVRAAQDAKLAQALEPLGVDWSAGPPAGPVAPASQVTLSLQPIGGAAKVAAGATLKIRGVVKNTGTAPAFRVRAALKSDDPTFDEREMVFGRVGPGETRTYELSLPVPARSYSRTDEIEASVETPQGRGGAASLLVELEGKPRPVFAYSYQTVDDQKGANRDGLVQRGERVRTLVTVRNIGPGPSTGAEAVVRSVGARAGIVIGAGRFDVKPLARGESASFAAMYEVRPELQGEDFDLELSVTDHDLDETTTGKIKVKVAPPGATFIPAASVKPAAAGSRVDASLVGQSTPPLVAVTAPAVVTGQSARITGRITDDRDARDVEVRVWNRNRKTLVHKVLYLRNTSTTDRTSMSLDAYVPVWPGSNTIQITARDAAGAQSSQMLYVLSRAARPAPAPRN